MSPTQDQANMALSTEDNRVNIANLDPQITVTRNSHIEATVALVWPYSSSHGILSLLLADRDVRLRKVTGQVKVTFHGRSAKEVAKTQVGIGDLVFLGLEGVSWTQAGEYVSTPGKKASYNLDYRTGLRLEVRRETGQSISVDVTAESTSPAPSVSTAFDLSTPRTTKIIDITRTRFSTVYHPPAHDSPKRVSSGSFVDASLDPFAEDDGYIVGKGRKRTKYARRSGAWRLLESTEDVDTKADVVDVSDPSEFQPLTISQEKVAGHKQPRQEDVVTSVDTMIGVTKSPVVEDTDPTSTVDQNSDALASKSIEILLGHAEVSTEMTEPSVLPPLSASPPAEPQHIAQVPPEPSHFAVTVSPVSSPVTAVEMMALLPLIEQQDLAADYSSNILTLGSAQMPLLEDLHAGHVSGLENVSKDIYEESTGATEVVPEQTSVEGPRSSDVDDEGSVLDENTTEVDGARRTEDLSTVQLPDEIVETVETVESIISAASAEPLTVQERAPVTDSTSLQAAAVEMTRSVPETTEVVIDLDALQRQLDYEIDDDDNDLFGGPQDDVIEDEDMYGSPAQSRLEEAELVDYSPSVEADIEDESESEDFSADQDSALPPFDEPSPDSVAHSTLRSSSSRVDESEVSHIQEDFEVQKTAVDLTDEAADQNDSLEELGYLDRSNPPHYNTTANDEGAQASSTSSDSHSDTDSSTAESHEDSIADKSSPIIPEPVDEPTGPPELLVEILDGHRLSSGSVGETASKQEENLEIDPDLPANTAVLVDESHQAPSLSNAANFFDGAGLDQFLTPPVTQQPVLMESRIVQPAEESFGEFPTSPDLTQMTGELDTTEPSLPKTAPQQIIKASNTYPALVENMLEVVPRRTSQRLTRRSFVDPSIGNEYFTPQRNLKERHDQFPIVEDKGIPEENAEGPMTTTEPQTTTALELFHDESAQNPPQFSREPVQTSRQSPTSRGGMTTLHSYFPHLITLEEYHGQLVDVMAVCASTPEPIQRAKSGPKDYYITIHLTDPSCTDSITRTAQIFRPRKAALPVPNRGDVILLRDMKLQFKDHKPMLLSTETSSWATFSPSFDTFHVAINGPPVEYGDVEVSCCTELSQWWNIHEGDYPETQMPNIPETPGKDVQPTSPRVTRSQLRKNGPSSSFDVSVDTELANNLVASAIEAQDKLTPLPQSTTSQTQPDLPSPTVSMASTSNRATRRRSSRRSESVVHELRDGTKYVDDDNSGILIHELRDGMTYIDE